MVGRKMKSLSDKTLMDLESHLAGTLKRVSPPRDIVQRLRSRIHFPQPDEIRSRLRDWNKLFFIFGGVMSGLLLIITLARMFFYLTGRRNLG